jgi:gluconolactonase
MTLEIVAKGLAFPEGPVALPNGDILLVEVMAGRLARVSPDGNVACAAELGGGPNGAAVGPDGRIYVCNNGGMGPSISDEILLPREASPETPPGLIQIVNLATGAFETLYGHCDATPFWAPNDLVFDAHGGFWFTDHGRDRGRVRTKGGLYYARADGSLCCEMAQGMLDSVNGVGLSPDGKLLYVADTHSGHLWRFKLSGPGEIDRTAGSFPHGGTIIGRAGPGQFLDSLAVDSAGNVCVASPGGSAILVFSPEGTIIRTVPTPDFLTTNICFGGPDLRTAFITLGSTGQLVKTQWEVPGLPLAYR